MTCQHSSGDMHGTWTRKPLPTAKWLLTSPESRKGKTTPPSYDIHLKLILSTNEAIRDRSSCNLYGVIFRGMLSVLYLLSAEGVMRTMTTEKLLKGMPVLQTQIDTLLEFDVRLDPAHFPPTVFMSTIKLNPFRCPTSSQVHPKELNNAIINAAFLLLFKDLVKLFASYNDGIINLLGESTVNKETIIYLCATDQVVFFVLRKILQDEKKWLQGGLGDL